MQVSVTYRQQLQFQAETRGHQIMGDQPEASGGHDQGMTPPEWFLASLGSCMGFYAVKYLEARDLDPQGLTIQVSAQKADDAPARLDPIQVDVHLPHSLEERHQKGLAKAIEACLIHNTLLHPPQLKTQIHLPVPA